MPATWAIVVAAGAGARFGGAKQYELLAGRRVVDWAIDAAGQSCDGVVLVVPEGRTGPEPRVDATVPGAATRSGSVRAGLSAVPDDAEVIVVHDAARPLASADLFRSVVQAVRTGVAGAIPGVAVTDTIRRIDGGVIDRRTLVAVQTPQAFDAAWLRRAHAQGADATDDAALVEAAGGSVVVVAGETANAKITEVADLALAEARLAAR